MSDFYLRVSTDVLKSKADEIKGQIQAIETNWKQLYVMSFHIPEDFINHL